MNPETAALEKAAAAYRASPTDPNREKLAELAMPVARRIAGRAWSNSRKRHHLAPGLIEPDAAAGVGLLSALKWWPSGRPGAGFRALLSVIVRRQVIAELRAVNGRPGIFR